MKDKVLCLLINEDKPEQTQKGSCQSSRLSARSLFLWLVCLLSCLAGALVPALFRYKLAGSGAGRRVWKQDQRLKEMAEHFFWIMAQSAMHC